MQILVDFSPFFDFFSLPPDQMLIRLLFLYGWIPLAFVFLWGVKELWMYYINYEWAVTQKFIFLAIDIPRGNEQSPRAVENMFSYLAGAHGTKNLIETYWEGQFQLSFSLEVVSIEGYTQFIIRTPADFRNLVESAVYSQYPDAEITEINDYTLGFPKKFPDNEYDLWGSEFIQQANIMLPIKTYESFEHTMGEDSVTFRDPMASLMDLYSSLGPGELLWFQIIITPIGFDWMDKGDKEISKILGEKIVPPKTFIAKIAGPIVGIIDVFIGAIFGSAEGAKEEKKDDGLKMMNLKPKQKKQIEAIQNKISKIAFKTKARMVYVAKKEAMNKPKAVNGFNGYLKQFTDIDLNGFKPDSDFTTTSTAYFFKDSCLNSRKTNIITNFMARDGSAGRDMGLLNVEELATLWHFPIESIVKAPLIQKSHGKRAEPPMTLPISDNIASEKNVGPDFLGEEISEKEKEDLFFDEKEDEIQEINKGDSGKKKSPPGNLPIIE